MGTPLKTPTMVSNESEDQKILFVNALKKNVIGLHNNFISRLLKKSSKRLMININSISNNGMNTNSRSYEVLRIHKTIVIDFNDKQEEDQMIDFVYNQELISGVRLLFNKDKSAYSVELYDNSNTSNTIIITLYEI